MSNPGTLRLRCLGRIDSIDAVPGLGYNSATMRHVTLANRYGMMAMCDLPRLVEIEAPPAPAGSIWA
jgi:hypothetical protein